MDELTKLCKLVVDFLGRCLLQAHAGGAGRRRGAWPARSRGVALCDRGFNESRYRWQKSIDLRPVRRVIGAIVSPSPDQIMIGEDIFEKFTGLAPKRKCVA
jgi:hypothetical protein